ncbi:MAG: hypothetical protein ACI9Y1_001471 [Lentisphaeria bacterium]|jgi:uncharacterized protein YaeQ
MAIKSTIFKVELSISDMRRHYYAEHMLTIARHPSETDERMMMRVLAFALNAHERMEFGKGLSNDDEPDVWLKSLSGEIDLWIDVGRPDEERIRKASSRANKVIVWAFGGNTADMWWKTIEEKITRFKNVTVHKLPPEQSRALALFAKRTTQLQCTIEDESAWLSDNESTIEIELTTLFPA